MLITCESLWKSRVVINSSFLSSFIAVDKGTFINKTVNPKNCVKTSNYDVINESTGPITTTMFIYKYN